MRRADCALPINEVERILRGGEYGTLSTVDSDGQPYGVPLNYLFEKDSIYFHCALEGHKLNNLRANSRVSFCVVGRVSVLPAKFDTEYDSVIATGSATEVAGEEKYQALIGLVKKYSAEFIDEGKKYIEKLDGQTAVFKISISSMTGKLNLAS